MGTHLLRIIRKVVDGRLPACSSLIGRRPLHFYCKSSPSADGSIRIPFSSIILFQHGIERLHPSHNHFNDNRQYISSLSNRIRDIVQSKSLTPTNPLNDSISQGYKNLDFSRLLPHHFDEAAVQYQSHYERQLESLENDINGGISTLTYEDVVIKLDKIVRPLLYLKNIVVLLSMVKDGDDLSNTLSSANEKIELTHEQSPIIFNALMRIEQDLISSPSSSKERVRVVQSLLLKSKLMGTDLDVQKEVAQLTARIAQLESKFYTLSSYSKEEHGKVTSARELLPYMYKILSLKKQRSQILGYENDVQMSLDLHNSTAENIDIVRAIHDLFAKQALEKIGSLDFISDQLNLTSDTSFLHDVRSHFELNHVLNGLFELCSSLFGIKIVEELQKDKINAWDSNVRLFHVYDDSTEDCFGNTGTRDSTRKKKLSSFYLDPYRRRHKSSGGFVAPISYKYDVSNDDLSESLVVVCLNIRPAMWDDSPVHIGFQDVVTMFHEFGHALQYLLAADVELGFLCGMQCAEEDASEVVSQFMEYWLFEGPLLSKLSQNPETGEPLPPEVIDSIKRWRLATKSLELSQRLFLGGLELEVNSNFDPLGDDSIVSLQREYADRFCPHQAPSKGNIDPLIEIFQNNAQGKCSVQYRYLWSEIMSADAFEEFSEVDGLNPQNTLEKGVGKKFRRTFLEAGNALSTMDAYRQFRKRDATIEPLLKMYGLLT